MKKWCPTLALATAAVYLALAVGAATCLFTHQENRHSVHHHGAAAHSSLCAWACQANQPAELAPSPPLAHRLSFVAPLLSVGEVQPAQHSLHTVRSRAPPLR